LDVSGTLSLGGTLVVTPAAGYVPKWHETKLIAAASAITGKFDSIPDTISGVLYPTASVVAADGYSTEVVTFEAAPFKSVLTDATQDQLAIGGVLDTDRTGSYTAMASVYDAIDTLADGNLSGALNALVPNSARSIPQSALLLTGAQTGFLWQYLGAMDLSNEAKVAVQTGALKLAQNSQTGSFEMRSLLAGLGDEGDCTTGRIVCATDASSGGGAGSSSGAMALPKGVGAFLSGQKIDGNVKLGGGSGKGDVDGYLIALGADMPVSQSVRLGLSYGYGEADTTLRDQPARSKVTSNQVLAYGMYMMPSGYFVNGYAGYAFQAIHTQHQVTLGTTTYLLDGHTTATTPLLGLQTGYAISDVIGGTVRPAVGVQYGRVQVDGYSETGGAPALKVMPYGRQSASVRIGFDSDWVLDMSGLVLKPQVHAFFVSNLGGHQSRMQAGFAAAPDAMGTFEIANDSTRWADLGLSLNADVFENTVLGFTFNANPGNASGTYTAVGGSLRMKF
jgi:outer membrane autotransporter protein